ncbi:4837_t:CDS:2 [Rhizophagus irregularis]|nr:4837_t:CDS:2 [Rhizophagus irregularis]
MESKFWSELITKGHLVEIKSWVNENGPIIFLFERQSIASSDRKGDGRGRRPDIMLVTNESDKLYELMYVECSRKSKPEKGQFGIVGVQVAGPKLYLNVLIRDDVEVHRYYKLCESTIPINYSNDPSILAEFIKTLLILQNIIIVNMYILCSTSLRRNLEDSSTVTSD